jgi:HEPN domain-containing protein
VLLQPAVVLSQQSVQALIKVIEARKSPQRQGKSLSEVLDKFGRPEISPERIAEIREHAAQRRAQGARSPVDLTEAEIEALRAGRAGLEGRRS